MIVIVSQIQFFQNIKDLIDCIFKFKEELRTLFPDWDALMTWHEVIRFACGIPTASVHILQFVYDLFVDFCGNYAHDKDHIDDSIAFMESLWKGSCLGSTADSLHNRYINII